jgi:hypothetical protein
MLPIATRTAQLVGRRQGSQTRQIQECNGGLATSLLDQPTSIVGINPDESDGLTLCFLGIGCRRLSCPDRHVREVGQA